MCPFPSTTIKSLIDNLCNPLQCLFLINTGKLGENNGTTRCQLSPSQLQALNKSSYINIIQWFVTHCTLEWFLLSVGEHVGLQVFICCKRLVAYGTLVSLYSSMSYLMLLEIAPFGECLVALSTLEWFLPSVDSHVPHQTCGCAKWFSTLGTFVRLLSSVIRQVQCIRCDLARNLLEDSMEVSFSSYQHLL